MATELESVERGAAKFRAMVDASKTLPAPKKRPAVSAAPAVTEARAATCLLPNRIGPLALVQPHPTIKHDRRVSALTTVASAPTQQAAAAPAAPRVLRRTPNGCGPFVSFASAFTPDLCRAAARGALARFADAFTPALCYVLSTCTGAARRERAERERALRAFTRVFSPELGRAWSQIANAAEQTAIAARAAWALAADPRWEAAMVTTGQLPGGRYFVPGVGEVTWSHAHFVAWCADRRAALTLSEIEGAHDRAFWDVYSQQFRGNVASVGPALDRTGFASGGGMGGRVFCATRTVHPSGSKFKNMATDRSPARPVVPAAPRTYWPSSRAG